MKNIALTRQDISILKGIAICAMLFHHLYFSSPDGIEKYTGLLSWMGDLGKVCVSIFLFCSGYGLATNYANCKDHGIKSSAKFVARRFMRFYPSYWVVLLLFIPISIFVFGRTFEIAYAGSNIPKMIIFEIFAINGFLSYNITWWFNVLIVIFYLLFPILFFLAERLKWAFVFLCLVLFRLCYHIPGNFMEVYLWQFPFVLGVFWSIMAPKTQGIALSFEKHRVIWMSMLLVLMVVLVFLRMNPIVPKWQGVRLDPFLTCVIAFVVAAVNSKESWISSSLSFLGKQSMNIYLTHTFFNGYWHPQWLHTGTLMRNGLNFVVLMSICLLVSILLEWIKERCGIYLLVNNMSEKIKS